MMFTLEALQANDGDCLLLHYQPPGGTPVRVLIDGGSTGVYSAILKPRLDQLRGKQPLRLRMAMVSHIDSDHITGMLDLLKALEEQQADGEDGFCQIQTLWHNSFEKLHGGKTAVAQSATVTASIDGVVPPDDRLDWSTQAVVASVPQGNQLRKAAVQLAIPINQGAGGDLVSAPSHGQKIVKIADGLTFMVLAPNEVQLARLRAEFDKASEKIKGGASDAAVGADYLNNTVPNMSSIAVMAETARPDGTRRRMLLTGDARGDVILESLELAGLMNHGRCHVDLLKIQHHCSSHSTTQDFFERVTADRYVISGNGKHDIPHADALAWLSAARTRQPYDVYMTNRIGILDNKKTLDAFLASEAKNEARHAYHFRNEKDLSISVDLG
jgi:beta-lactamase superfamily II metal-dependent hydrolase